MAKNANDYQKKWNEILIAHAPANISLVREISDLLDISIDSAYRRLRNETEYTLDEAARIANHFNLPLEALNNELHSVVSFRTNRMGNDLSYYKDYLTNMDASFNKLLQFEDPEIYFGAEDIPVFYHYSSDKLMNFKIIYWLKSLLLVPEYQSLHVESIEVPAEITLLAAGIHKKFTKVNATEIWTEETILSTLKQVRFYWDAGFFDKTNTAVEIVDDLESVIRGVQRQAEIGQMLTNNGTVTSSKYRLFISDVMIGTNSLLVKANHFKASFISYSTFNFMQTNNEDFNRQNEQWMNNLISRSILISAVAEKQRNQFFKSIYKQIAELRSYVLENA